MEDDQMYQNAIQIEPKKDRVMKPPPQGSTASVSEAFAGPDRSSVHAEVEASNQQKNIKRGRIENGEPVGVKDGWVLFALHSTRGRHVVKEGIVLVGDERVVCGETCQGFFAAPVPDDVKPHIQLNDFLPPVVDKVLFPNMFMLAPAIRQMSRDVAVISQVGIGEITHTHEVPADDHLPPWVDARVVAQIYRSTVASARRGEVPQPPEAPASETLPPGADARVVAQVYRAAVTRA